MPELSHGPEEFVIDRKTGQIRQAGATGTGTAYIERFRRTAEGSLYVFAKGVLGLSRLTNHLHLECARFLQQRPPYRKLLLLPRDHLKTALCSRALPLHILVQPKASNIYIPGKDGRSTRILLTNETSTGAEHQLRWIAARLETNDILRALWPHATWRNARKESPKWSGSEIMIPRPEDYPEASIETAGVGVAITGRHYDVMIKDDLISIDAASSLTIMQTAIEWHTASRALFDNPDTGLEFILGTRWAVSDLYSDIINNDPSVEPLVRAALEDGKPIFPEMFSTQNLDQLAKEMGPKFYLLYMNSASNPELSDFDMTQVREFTQFGPNVTFDEDERDLDMREPDPGAPRYQVDSRGVRLNKNTYDMMFSRDTHLRMKGRPFLPNDERTNE